MTIKTLFETLTRYSGGDDEKQKQVLDVFKGSFLIVILDQNYS